MLGGGGMSEKETKINLNLDTLHCHLKCKWSVDEIALRLKYVALFVVITFLSDLAEISKLLVQKALAQMHVNQFS